jgi:glycosyltransferase involved in cell wall biosynthesis
MKKTFSIAIDANEANVPQRVGSNAYAFEIVSALEKITADREDIQITILLANKPLSDLPQPRSGWQYKTFGPTPFWTQWALPFHLFWNADKYDVLFTPGHYAPRVSSVPYMSSVMDLAYLYFPKQFKRKDFLQLKEWTRYSVKHAQKIVAISEFTKQDIIKNYKISPSQIVVASPSITVQKVDIKEKERLDILKKWGIHHPFLLYVGTLQPRKNLIRLIDAFEKVVGQESESSQKRQKRERLRAATPKLDSLQLVIAGKVGWLADEIIQKIKNSPISDRIIVTGYVTEQEKIVLYQEAVASVLVGLYEGFGMPPLEAIQQSCIPIVSNTTSLPEVVGEGGILVDPKSTTDIAEGIIKVLELPTKERAKLLRKGRQQLKKFSWEVSAQKILEALEKIATQKK